MTFARLFCALLGLLLIAGIAWAWGAGHFANELQAIAALAWGKITLLDLYVGFLLWAVLVFLVEKNKLLAAAWVIPTFFLGNIVPAAWFVLKLPELARRLAARPA